MSNSQAYNTSPFQRFYGNSSPFKASQLQSIQASTVRGLLSSELNAVFAAKHFIFFISPILLKLEKEENDPMIGRRRVDVLWHLATLVLKESKQRQLTLASNYWCDPHGFEKVFFSGCGFKLSWFFSRQRRKLSSSATHAILIENINIVEFRNKYS